MEGKFPTPAEVAAQQLRDHREKQEPRINDSEIHQEMSLGTQESTQLPGQPVTTESVIAAQQSNAQAPRGENRGYRALRQSEIVRRSINQPLPTGLAGRLHLDNRDF